MYKYYERVPLEFQGRVAEDFRKFKFSLHRSSPPGGAFFYDENSKNYLTLCLSRYGPLGEVEFGRIFSIFVGDEACAFRNCRKNVIVLGGGDLSHVFKLEISKIYHECHGVERSWFEMLNPKFYQ